MPETPNKVRFNLKNVHYAILTETVGTGGAVTYSYATPVHVPGAVTLTLDAAGESSPFYADGIVYYESVANNGYTGDLEMAMIPDSMLTDVYGMSLDSTSKVITESANTETKYIALLFKIDGDQTEQDYVLYKCALGRPGIGSTTITNTKEPQTQTVSISANPRGDYKIKAHTTVDTPTATKSAWYTSVYDGAASSTNL